MKKKQCDYKNKLILMIFQEYINERNRAYLSQNGDQYAMPNKSRNRLESDCKYLG